MFWNISSAVLVADTVGAPCRWVGKKSFSRGSPWGKAGRQPRFSLASASSAEELRSGATDFPPPGAPSRRPPRR